MCLLFFVSLSFQEEKEDDRQEAQIWKKLSKRFEKEAQIRIAAEAASEKAAENKVCVRVCVCRLAISHHNRR